MHEKTKNKQCGWGFMCGDLTEPTVQSCLAILLGESLANKVMLVSGTMALSGRVHDDEASKVMSQ